MTKRHKNIPKNAQLVEGIGASSWFDIIKEEQFYRIIRYSENGVTECNSLFFILGEDEFTISEKFEFTYISHCEKCSIIQHGERISFKRLKSNSLDFL